MVGQGRAEGSTVLFELRTRREARVMDVRNIREVPAFTTKDGSEIRELLAYRNSCIRKQSLAEARLAAGADHSASSSADGRNLLHSVRRRPHDDRRRGAIGGPWRRDCHSARPDPHDLQRRSGGARFSLLLRPGLRGQRHGPNSTALKLSLFSDRESTIPGCSVGSAVRTERTTVRQCWSAKRTLRRRLRLNPGLRGQRYGPGRRFRTGLNDG